MSAPDASASGSGSEKKCWTHCYVCQNSTNKIFTFTTPNKFAQHLRDCHSTKEGGSYVCKYGKNGICSSLPLEGVSDKDYESHIAKHHVFPKRPKNKSATEDAEKTANVEKRRGVRSRKESKLFPLPSSTMTDFSGEVRLENSASQPNILHDLEHKNWTVYSSSQNLSSLLNDPLLPRSVSDTIFTKDWGTYFTDSAVIPSSTFLPKVSNSAFQNYIEDICRRRKASKQPQLCSAFSKPATSSKVENLIPEVFMKSEFNLDDYHNFKALLSFSQNSSLENSAVIQKQEIKSLENQLTDYLDVVEEHLARQISIRFRDFFHLMNAMDSVMDQLNRTIKEVTTVRKNCEKLQKTLVKPSLHNIHLSKARQNAVAMYEKIKLIATVHQTQPTIQLFLSSADYVGALDLISTSQEVVSQELGGLSCFRHLKSQLQEIEKVIDQMMKEDYVKFMNSEWNRPLTSFENKFVINDEERFSAIVLGMLRIQRFTFVELFKEEACTAINAMVKQTVIEILSREDFVDVDNRSQSGLLELLRDVEFSKWIEMLNEIFNNLFLLLRRIEVVYSVILRTLSEASGHSVQDEEKEVKSYSSTQMVAETDFVRLRTALKDALSATCDHAHSRCAEFVKSKSKDGSLDRLPSSDFVDLVKSVEAFAFRCEKICGRRSPNLRLVLQTQASKFVSRFHEEKKKKLSNLLEIEEWKPIEHIPDEFQTIVSQIVEQKSNFLKVQKMKYNFSGKSAKGKSYLVVNNEKFVVVNSTIALINLIIEYCQCAGEIESISPDLLVRLIDLLRHYNAAVSKLVLGGEATKVTGLKKITVKQLLICSRTLQLTVQLIPQIKSHFDPFLSPKHHVKMKHFEDINQKFLDHMKEIHEAVVSIACDKIKEHVSRWEAKPPVPSIHFQAISQHLKSLRNNTADITSHKDITDIFNKIHGKFKEMLKLQLVKLKIPNDSGPQHSTVILELTFYIQDLKKLKVTQGIEFSDEDLWGN